MSSSSTGMDKFRAIRLTTQGAKTHKAFRLGDVVIMTNRGGSVWNVEDSAGLTANDVNIIATGNGKYVLVLTMTAPLIASHYGLKTAAGDNHLLMEFVEAVAVSNNTKINLDEKGTYRTSTDRDLSLYIGVGWVLVAGWEKNNLVERPTNDFKKPMMIEKASGVHAGGEGRYTAFFGGATFQGAKVFMARNGQDHISYPTKVAKYIVDEVGGITKGVLKDENGIDMAFHDFRDANISLQLSLTQGLIFSGSELTEVPNVYRHYFMKLRRGSFDVEFRYSVNGFPSDEFMWGNAVHTQEEHWLKCTYGVSGAKLNKVYLYRATTNGSDPVSWTKIQDPLFENASECTLCYWRDKLIAITRSEPQTNGMQMRWTYDLEGLTGWSDTVNLPFIGAAPSVIPYIPKSKPLFLHFSIPDESTGYRMPALTSSPDLESWTAHSTGQIQNFTGSGAYGALVSADNGYSIMYYEEVGAVDGQTRVWLANLSEQTRVYPNADTVDFKYNQPVASTTATLLPDGTPCLGDVANVTQLITSSSDGGFFDVIPKKNIKMSDFVCVMGASASANITLTIFENGINKGTSAVVPVNGSPKIYSFPFLLEMKLGKTYRFSMNGNAKWYGRKKDSSPRIALNEDYVNYVYKKTEVESLNFNEFVLSHGFKIGF